MKFHLYSTDTLNKVKYITALPLEKEGKIQPKHGSLIGSDLNFGFDRGYHIDQPCGPWPLLLSTNPLE